MAVSLPKVSVKILLLTLGGIFLCVLLGLTAWVYLRPETTFSQTLRRFVPYPAMVVNTSGITFRSIDQDLRTVRHFYEVQAEGFSDIGLRIDFSTPDGQKRLKIREKELLNKMLEDMVVERLARERNIRVTTDSINQNVDRKLDEYGSQAEVTERLKRLYGWTLEDFKERIVRPSLYQSSLEEIFRKEVDTVSSARRKIKEAADALVAGKAFDAAVTSYSQGNTASNGGSLGWVALKTLTPETAEAVRMQKIGNPGEIVESEVGFHIIVVEERREEEGEQLARIKQIFTRKISFSDWLTEQMSQQNIFIWYRDYKWDEKTARIEFRSPDMRAFEEKVREQSQGDASLIF